MDKLINFVLVITIALLVSMQMPQNKRMESASSMEVTWYESSSRIFFELKAKTKGWLCIGFNDNSGMTGAYLIIGRIYNGSVDVVEHYTSSPGKYQSINSLGGDTDVRNIDGVESEKRTTISFSLPKVAPSKFQQDLELGKEYTMIIAYSNDDDFQHHSAMRVNRKIKL